MSFLSFFRHQGSEVDLILDIGSGSVGASLAVLSPSGKPNTVFSTRHAIPFQKKLDPARLPILLTETLTSVLDVVMKEGIKHLRFTTYGRGRIRDVYVVLASPWYTSHTKLVSIEKEVPFVVDKAFVAGVIQKEEQSFVDSLGEDLVHFDGGPKAIEHSVIRLALNGYETPIPYGKSARKVEMAIYVSVMSKTIGTLIDTAIHNIFQPHRIHFHSFGLSAFMAMRSIFSHTADFCFADIGSEVSDIFLVKKGVLIESVSVPCGKSAFIRRVVADFDIGPAVALSHIKLLIDKQADPTLATKVEQSLLPMRDEWVAHLTVALESLGRDRTLPDTLYVTVDEDVLPLFVSYASLIDVTHVSLSGSRLIVIPVLYEVCAPHLKKTATTSCDVFLGIEALHAQQLLSLPEEER